MSTSFSRPILSRLLSSCFLAQQQQQQTSSFFPQRRYVNDLPSSSKDQIHSLSGEISVNYEFGLPVLTVPLPSRDELCNFTLKPVTHTVGNFCEHIRNEDKGVDVVTLLRTDGTRISNSTPIEHILQFEQFHIRINDRVFSASPPAVSASAGQLHISSEHVTNYGEVKSMIACLHATLNVDEHQMKLEKELIEKLEELRMELRPLEEMKKYLAAESEKRAQKFVWLGLGSMGIQFGLFARLTWWEYSWDIMEPITYFVTYTTLIGGFAYFMLTKQSYEYPEARDRVYLSSFYRKARKHNFDVAKYNQLKESITSVEHDLKRIRDPLYLHLPLSRISASTIDKSQVKQLDELQ